MMLGNFLGGELEFISTDCCFKQRSALEWIFDTAGPRYGSK